MSQSLDPDFILSEELLLKGRLPASRLSQRFLALIAPALQAGMVIRVAAGAGHAYEVADSGSLRALINTEFSRNTRGYAANSPGARNLLRARNTKSGSRADRPQGLFVRTLVSRAYTFGARSGNLLDLVEQGGGVAGFRLAPETTGLLKIAAPLTLVENPEVFWHWEEFEPMHNRTLVLKGGVAPRLLLRWLAEEPMQSSAVEIAVDWDPTGLAEYRRFRDTLGATRVSLHAPSSLPELFQDLRKRKLLEGGKSLVLLSGQRSDPDPAICGVLALIDKHHAGLEHEALLLSRK